MHFEPVAHISSPYGPDVETPRQGILFGGETVSELVLEPKWIGAMDGLDDGDYALVTWVFNGAEKPQGPRGYNRRVGRETGIFASRSPHRPNPIGVSVIKLIESDHAAGRYRFTGGDMWDATPVLDIKPYSAELYPQD